MLKREIDGSLLLQLNECDEKYSSWIETLCFNFDFVPVGEEYCVSNYCMGIDLCFNGGEAYYSINGYQANRLQQGEEIRLYQLDEEYVKEMEGVWYE